MYSSKRSGRWGYPHHNGVHENAAESEAGANGAEVDEPAAAAASCTGDEKDVVSKAERRRGVLRGRIICQMKDDLNFVIKAGLHKFRAWRYVVIPKVSYMRS